MAWAGSGIVRPALAAEAGSCRAMLPGAFPPFGRAPELFVAVGPDGPVGAAAVAWLPRGFPVLVHVAANARRQGIGTALLAAAADSARGETDRLRGWHPLLEGSGASAFLAAAGFVVERTLLVFEAATGQFIPSTLAITERRNSRAGAGLRVVPLQQAPLDQVARMAAPAFQLLPFDFEAQLTPGRPDSFDRALSLVVMHGEEAVAAMLCRRTGNRLDIDAITVAPAWRRSWAQFLMVETIGRHGPAAGIDRVRFCCQPGVRDTLNLARRLRASPLPSQVVMTLPLGPTGSPR